MDAEFFFFVGAVLMVAMFGYLGVHKLIAGALDSRIDKVKNELSEAARLRAEAEALVKSFVAKNAEAEAQAATIVAQAKAEAEALAREAQARLEDYVARRTRQAEDKIAQAEAQATADVRSAAVDAAIKASENILKSGATDASAFVEQGIASVKALAN